jgi:hypothetical protein
MNFDAAASQRSAPARSKVAISQASDHQREGTQVAAVTGGLNDDANKLDFAL